MLLRRTFASIASLLLASALATPQLIAQSANPIDESILQAAVFEVVAIHPSPKNTETVIQVDKDLNPLPGQKLAMTMRFDVDNHGNLTMASLPIDTLIQSAWGLRELDQIRGGPAWIHSQRFNVTAKPSEEFAATYAKLDTKMQKLARQHMLQTLLAERFGFKSHRATEQKNILAMEIAKGGLKLKPLDDKELQSGGMTFTSDGRIKAHGTTLDGLASLLSFPLQKTVQDQTGDKSRYNVDLRWHSDTAAEAANDDNASAPSIYAALAEQLGLKLVPRKGTVETLVVDQAQMPSEN